LCPVCKTSVDPEPAVLGQLGIDPGVRFNQAAGCDFCRGMGAAGRTGIFELVTVTPTLRHLITSRASEAELREAARSAGSTSLFEDGLRKVLGGTVAYDELLRVDEPPAPLEG